MVQTSQGAGGSSGVGVSSLDSFEGRERLSRKIAQDSMKLKTVEKDIIFWIGLTFVVGLWVIGAWISKKYGFPKGSVFTIAVLWSVVLNVVIVRSRLMWKYYRCVEQGHNPSHLASAMLWQCVGVVFWIRAWCCYVVVGIWLAVITPFLIRLFEAL